MPFHIITWRSYYPLLSIPQKKEARPFMQTPKLAGYLACYLSKVWREEIMVQFMTETLKNNFIFHICR
jgi:hypothetical protein